LEFVSEIIVLLLKLQGICSILPSFLLIFGAKANHTTINTLNHIRIVPLHVGTCCIINMIQNNEMQMCVQIGICIWWNHFILQSLLNSKRIHTKKKHQPFKNNYYCLLYSIHIILSVIVQYMDITQFDVRIVFFHGELLEEIFMDQLLGFKDPIYPHIVHKLKNSIYGLKQTSHVWNKKFDFFSHNTNLFLVLLILVCILVMITKWSLP
jgi:hypothetical protein